MRVLRKGQKVSCRPKTLDPMEGKQHKLMTGRVLWIHPRGRFVRVVFDFTTKLRDVSIVECFRLNEVQPISK